MIGEIVGRYTVISKGIRKYHFICECECGNIREVQTSNLKSRKSKSCGCLQKKLAKIRHTKHGKKYHIAYSTWNGMITRCYNKKFTFYSYYGGNGIKVCDEWKDDPTEFIKWLEEHNWKKGLHIHRIDAKKDYSPENCKLMNHSEHTIYHNKNRRKRIKKIRKR